MLNNFEHILPEVVFDAVEVLGGRCTGRFIPLNAMENRVYSVEMEEGDNLIIKFYRPGRWSKETIQAEHDYLKATFEAEVPVVCPIVDSSGETILETSGVMYTVFPKKSGRLEPELNEPKLQRLGRHLALLHNVGSSFPKTPRMNLTPQTFGRDALQAIIDLDMIPPEVTPHMNTLVSEICERIEPLFENLPTILVHGDCHVGNVLWNQDAPHFIDFDDMLYAPPVQDIWMLTGGDDEYGIKNRDALLGAYEELRPFDRTSLSLVEPLRALRIIHFSAWIARRWEDGAFKMGFPQFGTHRYWQEQVETLSILVEKLRNGPSTPY